jgi:hypothetical protein
LLLLEADSSLAIGRFPMSQTSQAEIERARQLLALEGEARTSVEWAIAAVRVFDRLQGRFAPLVGSAGVQALLARSARLIHGEFDFLGAAAVETSAQLREHLQTQPPETASRAAVALFATFFTLLTDFIGERLTSQVLSSPWPVADAAASKESSDE